jgi:hypothetical protein
MSTENGKLIDQSIEIIKKTYQETNRLKDDLENLLLETEPSLKFTEEYSYSPNLLYLKPNHTFLFQRVNQDPESDNIIGERDLAMICIFYDEGGFNRINLKDQPEIWFGLMDLLNNTERCRAWDISGLLKIEERGCFKDESLMVDGNIYEYHWSDDEGGAEEWKGRFIGYPLVDIVDIDFLKVNAVDKLFKG